MRVSEIYLSENSLFGYYLFCFSGPSSGTVRPRRRANAARAHEVSRHFRESALVDFEARGQARPAPGSSRCCVSVVYKPNSAPRSNAHVATPGARFRGAR